MLSYNIYIYIYMYIDFDFCSFEKVLCANIIISCGADVGARNILGHTAADLATINCHPGVCVCVCVCFQGVVVKIVYKYSITYACVMLMA
jgi:hypothetical protein